MRILFVILTALFMGAVSASADTIIMGPEGMRIERNASSALFPPTVAQITQEQVEQREELVRLREQLTAKHQQLLAALAAQGAALTRLESNNFAMEGRLKQQVTTAATEATADRDAIDAALAELSSTMVRLEKTAFARDLVLRLAFADLQDEQARQYEEYRAVLDALSQKVGGLAGIPAQLEAVMGRLASIETVQATPAVPVAPADLSLIEERLDSIELALEIPPAGFIPALPGWDRWWGLYMGALLMVPILLFGMMIVLALLHRRIGQLNRVDVQKVRWIRTPRLKSLNHRATSTWVVVVDGERYEFPFTRLPKEAEEGLGEGVWCFLDTPRTDQQSKPWSVARSDDVKDRILKEIRAGRAQPIEQ